MRVLFCVRWNVVQFAPRSYLVRLRERAIREEDEGARHAAKLCLARNSGFVRAWIFLPGVTELRVYGLDGEGIRRWR